MPDLRIKDTSAAHVQRIACSAGSDGQPSLDLPWSIAPCNAMAAMWSALPMGLCAFIRGLPSIGGQM
jgi:hypothetical protein